MGKLFPRVADAATLGYLMKSPSGYLTNNQITGIAVFRREGRSNMANRTKDCIKTQSIEWHGHSCTYCRRLERGGISRLAILVLLLSFLALTGSCTVLFMYVREESRNMTCCNNLKQVVKYERWTQTSAASRCESCWSGIRTSPHD